MARQVGIWGLMLLASLGGSAQDSLSYWEDRAWAHANPTEADSLAYYYQRIVAHHCAADNLEGFLYAYWDWQAALFDDTETALALLDTAARQMWRSPETPAESEALLWLEVNRGYHRFQLGKVTGAVRAYERALDLFEAHDFPELEALDYLYLPLGAHYTRLGDNAKARTLYETALAKFRDRADAGTLAGLYNNLGLTYWNEGNQAAAIAVYEKGMAIKQLPPEQAGLLQLSAGRSYRALGQEAEAMDFADQALFFLEPLRRLDPPPEALPDYLSGAYLLKGQLLSAAGETRAALPVLQNAREQALEARQTRYHRTVAKVSVAIGDAWLSARSPERALRAYHAALCSLFPSLSEADATTLPDTAWLYGENAIYEALAGKADAWWEQYQTTQDTQLLQFALQAHQLASRAAWKLRGWLQYESSKLTLSSQSRSRVRKAIQVARALYEHTGDKGYLTTAWSLSEQVKAAVLLDAVRRNRATGPAEEAVANLRQQLAYFERQLLLQPEHDNRVVWLQERDELQEQLQTALAGMGNKVSWRHQPNAYAALPSAMKKGTTLLEFFVGDQFVDIFAQPPGQPPVWHQVPVKGGLEESVLAFQELVQSRQRLERSGDFPNLAFSLYDQLLAPLWDTLPARLLIVPDAWLSALPFGALYTEPGGHRWNTAPFLIQKTEMHYAYSLQVNAQQQQRSVQAPKSVLYFAPRFADGQRGLPPLRKEQSAIPQRWEKTTLEDAGADWSGLRQYASEYRILHLSTHGTAADSLPRIECYDRPAYLPDIYALPLNAELVVLSACESSLGTYEKGEGVMSLSRAFTYAGSQGLVATLWPINELATGRILNQFYEHLETGSRKAEALTQAKRDYLASADVPVFQKSPYYWAGVVYVGADGALQQPPAMRLRRSWFWWGVWARLWPRFLG